MINLSAVATEVFQILRSFDYTVMMYDDDGMQVYEPDEARRLFAKQENLLVSINDENDNSCVNLYLSGKTDAESVLGLITSLRTAANKYNMIFNNKQWHRDFTVKDFASKSAVRENKEPMIDLTEGMFGTSRSSYLKLENARMIVRHSAKIDENVAGARCRRVESIFCENAAGERFLFPTRQLAPARAMTQHFNHGGSFADQVGQQITQMAQDYSSLGQATSFIGMNQPMMAEGAGELREKCRQTRREMKKCFERLYRESTYDNAKEELEEAAAVPTLVEDATVEKLREMLAVEGKELSEDVVNTIARCVESANPVLDEAEEEMDVEDDSTDARQTVATEKGDTISVLDHQVNLAAWEKLKNGSLAIRADPESIAGSPNYSNRLDELGHKLSNLAPVVISDSIANLLSWAAGELQQAANGGRSVSLGDQKLRKQLVTLASHSLKAAKVQINEGLGFRGSRVIREFEDWFDSMGSENVLSNPVEETDMAPVGEFDTPEMGSEMTDMGPLTSDLDNSAADDEAMAADIALGYTDGADWHLDFPQADAAYAAAGGEDAVHREISAAVLGGSRNGSVHSLPENGARQSFEWSIANTMTTVPAPISAPVTDPVSTLPIPAPVPPMTAPEADSIAPVHQGIEDQVADMADMQAAVAPAAEEMADEFGDAAEFGDAVDESEFDDLDGDLTREDILLPNNQNIDLQQEVGHPASEEEEGELTMERLRKLSGIKIA